MVELRNFLNGFVRLETGRHIILCDVWLEDGIFDNSWVAYPRVRDKCSPIAGATHCFISHIHEDHYDLATLSRLDRAVQMLVPDVYPNYLIDSRLRQMGFRNVRMLTPGVPEEVSTDLTVEVIPKMNAFGQELKQYEREGCVSLVIDTGILISSEGLKVALMADNVPYRPEDAAASLERMKGCDLLGFSYNGAASDYPLCYENLTIAEKREIADAREDTREKANLSFIERIAPCALLPYSSEFALQGPVALDFARWCSGAWWADKRKTAERYQRSTGLRSFALYEGDVLTIAPDSRIEYSRGSEEPPDLLEFEKAHFSPTANTRHHFPAIGDLSCLDELAHRAASHMFAKMNRLGLSSEWVLALAVSDGGWEPWYVDLAQRQCTRKRPADRPMLTCRSESNYLVALLTGNTHWNNAMISFNLRWHRFPDVYDRPLFDAMNFFHVPRDS